MDTDIPVNLSLLQAGAGEIPPLAAIAALLGLLLSMAAGLTAYVAVVSRIGRTNLRPETVRSVAATVTAILAGAGLLWLGLAGIRGIWDPGAWWVPLGTAVLLPLLFTALGSQLGAGSSLRPDSTGWNLRAGGVVTDLLACWLPRSKPGNGNGHSHDEDEPEFEITMASGEEVEAEEREYIENILEMGDTTAHEVMTPRTDVVALDAGWEPEQVIEAVAGARYSRFPVYQESIDDVIGVLHIRDLLEFLARGKGADKLDLRSMLMKPLFIPESKKVDDVLRELQVRKSHMAVVLDEYGGTEGILTIEDLLEEIVGEIQDEFDDESAMIHRREDGSLVINGQLPLDELNEELGTVIETEEADTLAGFIIHELGHIPESKEAIFHSGHKFSVLSVDKQRIDLVLVSRLAD